MTIRPAKPEDMWRILELIQELAEFEKEPDAVEITEQDLIKDGFGDNPAFEVIVAEQQNQIIGMALFYNRYSTWKGKTIHLEDLIVTQSQRKTGAGKALYKEVMRIAALQDVKRVEWVVLDWNENAINFYEKSGANVLTDWRTVQMTQQKIKEFIS